MPREKKVPAAPAPTGRERLAQVLDALDVALEELQQLHTEVEPRSRNAEAILREARAEVVKARKSIADYIDELAVWDS